VYVEEVSDRKAAMKREIAIKKMPRGKKMKLMEGAGLYKARSEE
jgi:predicted GIY-YIG superfamily endonuclease